MSTMPPRNHPQQEDHKTNIRVDVYLHQMDEQPDRLAQILTGLADLKKQGVQILMDEAQVKTALDKIDVATTKIGETVTAEAATIGTIGTDVDALQSALAAALASGGGVTQALVDQANALSDKAQASSDALAALGPVLDAIASKGVINPVPVPVPAV